MRKAASTDDEHGDDQADNRFLEVLGRFPEIKEDEEPLYLLVGDYGSYYTPSG